MFSRICAKRPFRRVCIPVQRQFSKAASAAYAMDLYAVCVGLLLGVYVEIVALAIVDAQEIADQRRKRTAATGAE